MDQGKQSNNSKAWHDPFNITGNLHTYIKQWNLILIKCRPVHTSPTHLQWVQGFSFDEKWQRWIWDSSPLHWITCVHIGVSPLSKAAAPSTCTGAPQSSSLHTTSASCWSKTASHTDIHDWSWSISNLPEQWEPPTRRTPEKKTWTD